MKLIPERELRKLVINNNRIVCPINILESKYFSEYIKKEWECILLQFLYNGDTVLAVCEIINNQKMSSEKKKKGDVVLFKAENIRFIYE